MKHRKKVARLARKQKCWDDQKDHQATKRPGSTRKC